MEDVGDDDESALSGCGSSSVIIRAGLQSQSKNTLFKKRSLARQSGGSVFGRSANANFNFFPMFFPRLEYITWRLGSKKNNDATDQLFVRRSHLNLRL